MDHYTADLTTLAGILRTLTQREEEVLTLRFGLNGEKAHTRKQVGERFNVTGERIRHIEIKGLFKLKADPVRLEALRALSVQPFVTRVERARKPPEPDRTAWGGM